MVKTSWKGRHRKLILEALAQAENRGMRELTLIDIAPGAVTRLLSPRFPPRENLATPLLVFFDQILRRTTRLPLSCPEIEDILDIFGPLEPKHLYALYTDPALAEYIPENDIVLSNPTDIEEDNLLELGDVVFCYDTIPETDNPKACLENVLKSVKVGGLLSVDKATDWQLDPRTNPLFIQVAENLYAKEF